MQRKTILVADDDAGLLKALTVRLESAGYHIVQAQDAVQAVSVARRSRPDLLLLDINMPAGDGFTILQRIHAIETLQNVPVIYLTGERSTRAAQFARETGARALLFKPVDSDHLLATVAEAVGGTETIRTQALDELQLAADQRARSAN